MVARILVAYSRVPTAQLEEAARQVGDVFSRAGAEVAVRAVNDVESLSAFDSVVLCGPVSPDGNWASDADRFVHLHRRELAYLSVAYLVTYGSGADLQRDRRALTRALGYALNWINEVRPVAVEAFPLGRRAQNDWGDIRAFAVRLKSNFISPTLESPSGIRPFLHGIQSGDHSEDAGYTTVPGFAEGSTATRRQLEGPPYGDRERIPERH